MKVISIYIYTHTQRCMSNYKYCLNSTDVNENL